MAEQFKLFEKSEPQDGEEKRKEDTGEGVQRKPKIITKLPRIDRAYEIVGGYAERIVKTRVEHTCGLCGREIAVGSHAKLRLQIVDDRVFVNRPEYYHLKGQCPVGPDEKR